MKNYKIKRTLVEEDKSKVEEYLDGVCHNIEECYDRICKALEATYGDDWKMLHWDDIDTDKNGLPHYYFDMEYGAYEEYSVEEEKGGGK